MSLHELTEEDYKEWLEEGDFLESKVLDVANSNPELLPVYELLIAGFSAMKPEMKQYLKYSKKMVSLRDKMEARSKELEEKLTPYEALLKKIDM